MPYPDNEAWTGAVAKAQGYKQFDPWHAWMYNKSSEGEVTSQVGGYATNYGELLLLLLSCCCS